MNIIYPNPEIQNEIVSRTKWLKGAILQFIFMKRIKVAKDRIYWSHRNGGLKIPNMQQMKDALTPNGTNHKNHTSQQQ